MTAVGADPLKNGNFEWECTCAWKARTNTGGLLPSVFVPRGNPCSYLKVGTNDSEEPPTSAARAWQEDFTVTAGQDDWVVIDFDARLFGSFFFPPVAAELFVDSEPQGTNSSLWTPIFVAADVWGHYRITAQAPDANPTVRISFMVCEENLRMDVDNVVASSSSANPCPMPEDCDMEVAGFPQFCLGDEDGPLFRQGECSGPCPCTADFSGNSQVDTPDMLQLLQYWTDQDGCYQEDLNCDKKVDTIDFLDLLGQWGSCNLQCPLGMAGGFSGPPAELEAAVAALGFTDLAAYEQWLAQASSAQALASGYALVMLLQN